MGAPSDRNLVSFYADAGVIYNGPFDRKNDKMGLAIGYARVDRRRAISMPMSPASPVRLSRFARAKRCWN
jgi:carbohydrate-selective porin OprB